MIEWSDEQLDEAGIIKSKLEALVKKLRSCSVVMRKMGFEVYGNGTGYLIHRSRPTHTNPGQKADPGSIVAEVGQGFNGGDW